MIGLRTFELKVFKALDRPMSVAQLTLKLKAPRMTVYSNLLRLQEAGLVRHVSTPSGKRVLFERAEELQILKEVEEIKKVLISTRRSRKSKRPYSFSGFRTYSGKEEISQAIMELTKRTEGGRLYSIQTSDNWNNWIKLIGKDKVNEHNSLVVKHKLLSFSLHSPKAPENIEKDETIIKAYKGRLGHSRSIPEAFLKRNLSFYVFEEIIFFVNLEKAEAFSFRHHDFSSFLVKMFMFMFEHSDEEEFFLKFNK